MSRYCLHWICAAVPVGLPAWTPAQAATAYERSSGWQVVQGEDSCTITMGFVGPGATRLILVRYISGDVSMLADNTTWLAADGTNYTVRYQLDGKSYGGADAIGTTDYSRKGFFSRFDAGFGSDFAKASTLQISVGDKIVGRLSLAGAAAAMATSEHCLASVRARLAATAREKVTGLDLLPQISPGAAMQSTPKPPTPIGFIANWASTKDYPSRMRRKKGVVATGYTLAITADGMVAGCTVTASSGYPDLDTAACRIVSGQARFNPATGASGRTTTGTYSGLLHWITPK